jgi:hypothetical protein
MGKILYGPWAKQLPEEHREIDLSERPGQTLLSLLTEARNAVQIACAPFETNGDVRPVHCRKALNTLEQLDECLQNIFHFFQGPFLQDEHTEAELLSANVSSSLYQFLTPLCHTQEQISVLTASIDAHRLVCSTPSQQSGQQRHVIQEQFAMLESYLTSFFNRCQPCEEKRPSRKQG